MTREERKKAAKEFKEWRDSYYNKNKLPATMFIEEVIKILEQEPCGDSINRQAVLETLDDMDNALDEDRTVENYKELLKECYEVLPSVNPQPKTGHWIKSRDCYGNHHFTCSECGNDISTQYADNWEDKYCSECGCRMVEPQESEDKE